MFCGSLKGVEEFLGDLGIKGLVKIMQTSSRICKGPKKTIINPI